MEHRLFKLFGKDRLESVEEIPAYCANVVKLLANESPYPTTGIRSLPTILFHVGPICTFLHAWTFPDSGQAFKIAYPRNAQNIYERYFLHMKGDADPFLLENIEKRYREKIKEMQSGWRFVLKRREPEIYVIKESTVVGKESELIRFLGGAFGFKASNFCYTFGKKIHLTVKTEEWEKFQRVFRLEIEEKENKVLFKVDTSNE